MFKGQASYCCLLNKQEISSTVPTMKRERLLSWRAGSHWRETEVHCLCWEADWDLLFFDQRHNKITSLPLSTTSTFDSFFWSHPHLLLPPVTEEKETEGAFRCLKKSSPSLYNCWTWGIDLAPLVTQASELKKVSGHACVTGVAGHRQVACW